MNVEPVIWPTNSICLRPDTPSAAPIASSVYESTCRTKFDAPGFCVINCGSAIGSNRLRELMVQLKREMASIHEAETNRTLIYWSVGRFDQQETTRPHLDGGPDECFLMLGYEPSQVDSQLEILDYSKCAFDMGASPKEFMAAHNPAFQGGQQLLQPYTTRVPCFSKTDFQIVCINNSSASYSDGCPAWQGTLHSATILNPDDSQRRVINSTMIASVPVGTPDAVSEKKQAEFVSTTVVRRRNYNSQHLDDDG